MPGILWLKLLTAHLVGDFLLQSASMAERKQRPGTLAVHGALHAATLVLVALTEPPSLRLAAVLAGLLAAHLAIDAWTSRRMPRDAMLLLVDQSLHVATLLAAAALARPADWSRAGDLLWAAVDDPRVWAFAGGWIAAVWVGAIVVGRWVGPFADGLTEQIGDERPGLRRAGRAIGLFERALIFLAIVLRFEALVGFVVAAKAILRLPEARERGSRELAEYYLVGSLASVFWAVAIAVLTRWFVTGRP